MKKVDELRGEIGAIRQVLTHYQKTTIIIPQKNEPFSQEMHLKMPPLSLDLKLANPKPVYRVSALHLFVK
jgi:hypothetical protein